MRPAFTAPISSRSSCSSIEASLIAGTDYRCWQSYTAARAPRRLDLAVPVPQLPQRVVAPTAPRAQIAGHCRYRGAVDDRDDGRVADHEVIHRDEQRRPLDRVELTLGLAECLVVPVIAPACNVAALPFVLF